MGHPLERLGTKFRSAKHPIRNPGVLSEKLDCAVRRAFENPYHMQDQNVRFFLPYLWPDQKFDTLFKTLNKNVILATRVSEVSKKRTYITWNAAV